MLSLWSALLDKGKADILVKNIPQLISVLQGCLQRHMLCHSNQKHYICPYCEKQFSYSSACRQHIKTHVKEVLSNSEKNKNNLKAAVLVSKADHMPQQQQQTLVELVNAVEQRTVSVINAPGTHFNQLGQQILTKYSVQMPV
jgi:uncharacterized Zn-finger protein